MANVYEQLDNTLRGEPYGQLTPEGNQLWGNWGSLVNTWQNMPMRNVRLKSGATIQVPDPGTALKAKGLSNVLQRMQGSGLGDRAKAQPGLFSQMAPFLTALGSVKGKDGKNWLQALQDLFKSGGYSTDYSYDPQEAIDWDNAFGGYDGLGDSALDTAVDIDYGSLLDGYW